jgi:uncharacterized protein DUF4386
MMDDEIGGHARRLWARWTGLLFVLTNASAMFAVWTRGSFVAARDPATTAANIAGSETWFRLGLAFDLLTIAGVVPLVAGLYIVLKPVGSGLALLATLWRAIENAILAMLTFASFTALTLLGGGDFMRVLDPRAAGDLAYALIRVHSWGFQVGFLFLGLGQAVFSLLWWRSLLVPRWLAGLGIVASSIMAAMALGIIVWPPLYSLVTMAYMAPMGLYEIGLGLWLLIAGIRLPDQRK